MKLIQGVGDIFALDIGTNALRTIQLSGDAKAGWNLKNFSYVPVDPAIIRDSSEAGKQKLGEAILTAVNQAGIKTKNVALGIPAAKSFMTVVELPTQPINDLNKTIEYQIGDYIPMPPEEAEKSWTILGPSPNDPNKVEALISATDSTYAEGLLEDIEALGFNVAAMEPDQLAMARALTPVGATDARLILDLGEQSADLVISYGGQVRLVRTVPGGLNGLTKAVAGNLTVRDDQARQFILKFGLAQDKLEGHVFKVLSPLLETFTGELAKSIQFFENKYTSIKVGGIILTGFAAVIPFMAEYVEAKLNIASIQGNPWQFVRVTPEQKQALLPVASEFSVAIGLAERINQV